MPSISLIICPSERQQETEALWAAPHCYRSRVLELLDREIDIQKNGGHRYVHQNQLVQRCRHYGKDGGGVTGRCGNSSVCARHLLSASGHQGIYETITVRALLGRYLEHSRIFVFGEGERQRIFLSAPAICSTAIPDGALKFLRSRNHGCARAAAAHPCHDGGGQLPVVAYAAGRNLSARATGGGENRALTARWSCTIILRYMQILFCRSKRRKTRK